MTTRGRTGDMRSQVLAYLQHEADMDGLVTVSQQEIGDHLGVTQKAVSCHIAALIAEGVASQAGWSKGVRGHAIMALQLSEEAMA